MSKSLVELAKEYERSIELLSECIPDIRAEYKKAVLAGDSEKAKTLARKLTVVYEEIRDMRIVAHSLKHYYDDCDCANQIEEAS